MERNILKGVVDRFEENKAVVKLDNGQQILWPKENLSADIKEGSVVDLVIINEESEQKEREKTAKTLLNEILKKQE